jgi:nicotinamide-nucleotide amidase
MHVELLNTGSELLLGKVVNTHLPFLAEQLFPLGLTLARQTTVPDGPAIGEALVESFLRSDLVLVTGGLGPTTDDLTRELTADLLGLRLEHDPEVAEAILARFQRRGIPLSERVLRQAMRPESAEVLPNPFGTAPGLYLPAHPLPASWKHPSNPGRTSPHLFLLPGPPRELRPMVENCVLPKLRQIVPAQLAERKMETWRIVNVPESVVEAEVGEALLQLGVELGYCARLGEVDVRLIGSAEQLQAGRLILSSAFEASMLPAGSGPLEEWVIAEMTQRGVKLALAESCTGGGLAHRLTNVPGASAVFLRGFIPYANAAKESLGVPSSLLERHGAVSEPVAAALCQRVRELSGADYALATTGIAGPGGGSEEKPVGTVFIGLATPKGCRVEKHRFSTDRLSFKQLTTQAALNLLRNALLSDSRVEVAPA